MIARTVQCLGPHGFHRLAYVEWPGAGRGRTILCVHGLTRNGRDFDRLAASLSARARVVCPDMAGRGLSEWLAHAEDYVPATYLADIAALLARLDETEIDWVGTSMGGILGMLLAALPGTPIRRLVLNDVGPLIAAEGLNRIATYVGRDPGFPDLAALEAAFRLVAAPFGPLTDEEWQHLARHSARRREDGSLGFAYDPRISDAFPPGPMPAIDLWAQWDAIRCPTLVLRGADSDILRREDAAAMAQRGPRAVVVELPGVGHAPALMAADQIRLVSDFLSG